MSSGTMTIAQYAAHRGCSDSYIRRMRRTGKLVMHADGKHVVVQDSDALLDDITDPIRGGDRTPNATPRGAATAAASTANGGPTTQEAVRRERLARARLAELELGEETRQLTRAKDVERAVFTLVREALNSLLNMPAQLRMTLAAESEPRKVEAILDKEIRRIADKMQRGADNLAGQGSDDDEGDA